MRKIITLLFLSSLIFISCSYNGAMLKVKKIYKDTYTVAELAKEKDNIDKMSNPASKYVRLKELKQSLVYIEKVQVKDIVDSTNIDYDFCIIADFKTPQGNVECYIYTKEMDQMAELKAGVTNISILGYFGRFFTLLDNYYAKIDILQSDIVVME